MGKTVLSFFSATGELTPRDSEVEGVSPSPSYKKSSESEANTPRTPHSARFEDNMFFGKNFDIEKLSQIHSGKRD